MWKIYCLFGFDNFFASQKEKKVLNFVKHNQIEIYSSKLPNFKKNLKPSNIRHYSDEEPESKNRTEPFEYPSPTEDTNSFNFSESSSNRKLSFGQISYNYFEKADEILKELMIKTNSSLQGFELIHEEKNSPDYQTIYLKSYLNKDKHRINIYRSEWKIPCTPELFLEFMNDLPLQITLDSNIQEFNSFENVGQDVFLMYLLYKKMYIVDSRDFVYLKHYKLIDEENKIWGYTSKSILHEKYPEMKGKVRGEIILSGSIIKQINENESIVLLYSEIDLKINIPVVLMKSKTVSEMKKYVQSFFKYLQNKK